MQTSPKTPVFPWRWLVAALVLGSGAGAADLIAGEVQGPLLLLMTTAFVLAVPRRAPAWMIATATWLGLPLAHVVGSLWGGDQASFGMLIALPPTLIGGGAGALVGRLIEKSAGMVPRESLAGPSMPWYRRAADSRLLLLAALAAAAVADVFPVYATLVARGQPVAWWVTLWWQVVTFIGWVALLPGMLAAKRRLTTPDAGICAVQLVAHLALVTLGAAVHAIIVVALNHALFVPLGNAGFGSAVGWAFAAYYPADALAYALVLTLAHASDRDRGERLAREHTAALSAQLDRARLTALEARIRPHFLFNALNAAVVLVKRGPGDDAIAVLTGLAELLRYVMDDTSDTVPLDAELAFVSRYLAIEQVRLGDRLRWRVDVGDATRGAVVPRLVLQPLVENSVRHGIGKQLRGGTIVLSATTDRNRLRLTVEDDGPGLDSSTTSGIGIANTRARLETFYRGDASLELRPRGDGGCIAEVVLPLSTGSGARSA